ncbi:protein kinase C zeta type-like [Gordionus sp. m RMFG-2023]|uniref:protein kinase C zeta type-like n=1 Tax=Gordionus sp. m RMFG-2023 TaxID=3053472 RepID=UPI0031FBABFD
MIVLILRNFEEWINPSDSIPIQTLFTDGNRLLNDVILVNTAINSLNGDNKKVNVWSRVRKCFGCRRKEGIRPDGLVINALMNDVREYPIFKKCFENRGIGKMNVCEDGVEGVVRGMSVNPCKDNLSYPIFKMCPQKLKVEDNIIDPVEDVKYSSKDDTKIKPICTDYDFVKLIGQGGAAKVFLARSKTNGKEYAAKVIRKQFRDDIEDAYSKRLIHREKLVFDKTKKLPFMVELFAYYHTPMNYAFIMEYVDGGDLHRHLRHQPNSTLPEHHARFYAAEITLALHHLHSRGIIHRDVKPENILLCSDGHIKLSDYGLCTDILPSFIERRKSLRVGTVYYKAPEVSFDPYYSYSIDWWALGVVLYEMLVGKLPFGLEAKPSHNDDHYRLQAKYGRVKIPISISFKASSIIRGFLTEDPKKRLGGDENGGLECFHTSKMIVLILRNFEEWINPSDSIPIQYKYNPRILNEPNIPSNIRQKILS